VLALVLLQVCPCAESLVCTWCGAQSGVLVHTVVQVVSLAVGPHLHMRC
jgi:hypothetical protein